MGWRWTFILAGIAGFVWLLFWIPMYDVPEKHKRVTQAEYALIHSDKEEAAAAGGRGLAARSAAAADLVLPLGKFLTDPVWWFFLYLAARLPQGHARAQLKTAGCPW